MMVNTSVQRVEGEIPSHLTPTNGDVFLFISNNQRAYTHAIHRYPAKFFPELPRWIIKKYTKPRDWVLDPFAGSGTVNLESMLLGRNSVGIDVDPFARFLIRVKTTILDQDVLKRVERTLQSYMEQFGPMDIDLPNFPYRDHWFNHYTLQELAYIKQCIFGLQVSKNIRNFLLVVFSSVIRAVSNADNNCTRTVVRKKLNKQVKPNDAIRRFMSRLSDQIERMPPPRPTTTNINPR